MNSLNFCEFNNTIRTVWYKNGLSYCFYDFITSICLIVYASMFGFIHVYKYRKRGTYVDAQLKPKSKLFTMQLSMHFLFALWPFVELALYASKVLSNDEEEKQFYGRSLLVTLAKSYAWTFFSFCLLNERNYVNFIITTNSRRHSTILVVFWLTYLFVNKNLAFVSIKGELWFWRLQK